MAKITLFGLAGTGTSTTGKALASQLGYPFMSSGNLARQEAKELGMTIYERGEAAKKDPKYDMDLDKRVELYGKEHENLVFDSWLAWHFIPDSIKIKLTCDFNVRIARVARRDGTDLEDAKKLTLVREAGNAERYSRYYAISDFSSDDHFDLILDTTSTPVSEIVARILEFIHKK
jgi:cytidylate kinase